jgi:hypothetical protein
MPIASTLFRFAARKPGTYFALCCTVGLAIRFALAKGDLWTFLDPRFPLFQ